MSMTNKREIAAIQLLTRNNAIKQTGESIFSVRSQSDPNRHYQVVWRQNRWLCSCPDFQKSKKRCKHIYAVNYYQALKQIAFGIKDTEIDKICPCCNSMKNVTRRGWRYNLSGPKQIYYCKNCKIKFGGMAGFSRMKKEPAAIVLALDLYFKGLSLRKITEHMRIIYDLRVTHATVYNWIRKYVKLIKRYVDSDVVNTSKRWHADETVINLKGSHVNMWALMDHELKILIASRISKTRETKHAKNLIEDGMKKSNEKPTEIVTDGLPSYKEAIEELAEKYNRPIVHIQGPFAAPLNNNLIERFFGTVKERTKQFRGLDNDTTAEQFVDGFVTYYNNIRSHSSLNGKTPSEAAGLQPKLENNRWLQLIRFAGKNEEHKKSVK